MGVPPNGCDKISEGRQSVPDAGVALESAEMD